MASKLFEMFQIVEKKDFDDLRLFMNLSIITMSEREKEIATKLLELAIGGSLPDEDIFMATELEADERVSSKWRKTKTNILKMLCSYYASKALESEDYMKDVLLARMFLRKRLTKNLTEMLNKQTRKPGIFPESLGNYFMAETEAATKKGSRRSGKMLSPLQNMDANLNVFYYENKLRCLCEQLNRAKITKTVFQPDLNFVEKVELKLSQIKLEKHQQFFEKTKLYFHLFKMLHEPSNKNHHSDQVERLLELNKNKFPRILKIEAVSLMLNFNMGEVNKGRPENAKQIVKLAEYMKAEDMLLHNDKIDPNIYLSFIKSALVAEEVDWAIQFCNEQKKYLPDDKKNNIYALAKAQISCYQGNYSDCREDLLGYEFNESDEPSDPYNDLSYKKLYLKSYLTLAWDNTVNLTGKVPDLNKYREYLSRDKKYVKNNKTLNAHKQQSQLLFFNAVQKVLRKKEFDIQGLEGNVSHLDFLWLLQMSKIIKP